MSGPLEQFKVKMYEPHLSIGGLDISFNNSALFMVIALVLSVALIMIGMSKERMIPGRLQSLVEVIYGFARKTAYDIAGPKVGPYIPIVFSIFIFVLFGNMLGMVPFSFTYTSHIIVTFILGVFVILFVTAVGFAKHGLHFLHIFLPSGVPMVIAPIVIAIELVSYFARPVSLSIRLAANMLAGHVMLKLFAGFTVTLAAALGIVGYAVGTLPVAVNIALIGFEFFVAGLQAYIFTLFTCVYLRDALEMHHTTH